MTENKIRHETIYALKFNDDTCSSPLLDEAILGLRCYSTEAHLQNQSFDGWMRVMQVNFNVLTQCV